MQGGPAAIRGFALQTLTALLRALESDGWSQLTLEPDEANQKVDIKWAAVGGATTVVQVRSSANPITAAQVRGWAAELAAVSADRRQLVLFGAVPGADTLRDVEQSVGVSVEPMGPVEVGVYALAAAHLIDRFLQREGGSSVPPALRELLAAALAERLLHGSVASRTWTRNEFEESLRGAILASFPDAFRAAEAQECHVLWDHITVTLPEDGAGYALASPIECANTGKSVVIVEWAAIRATLPDGRGWQFHPRNVIDELDLAECHVLRDKGKLRAFSAFAVRPQDAIRLPLSFGLRPVPRDPSAAPPFEPTTLELFVKFRADPVPRLVRRVKIALDAAVQAALGRRESSTCSLVEVTIPDDSRG